MLRHSNRFARPLHSIVRSAAALLILCAAASLSACNSGNSYAGPPAPQLNSISVSPPDSSLAMGLTTQFSATGMYSDGSKKDISTQVTWSSSNSAMASISSSGLAMPVSPGSVTITATLGSVSGSTGLTTTVATLVVIDISPALPSIASGLTQTLTATGVYTDNSVHNLTAAVVWSSSAPLVATVSNSAGSYGLATSLMPGSTIITATLGSVSGTATLTVTSATLVSIGVTPANLIIANGLTQQFTATGIYTDNSTHDLTNSAIWSSSATTAATISNSAGSNGLATAVSPGPTTISAAIGAISGSTTLTVTAATLVSIGVTPANPSVASGLQPQFMATGIYTDNSTQNLTTQVVWSSSASTVATVSNSAGFYGLASTFMPGTATVTATMGGISGSTGLTVTAATLVSISVTPATSSIASGLTQQFVATGLYTDNSTQDLTLSVAWTSLSTTVATINNASGTQGLATGVSPGMTTITAAYSGTTITGSTTLTVTPASLVSIAVIPANPSIAYGTSQQFAASGTYTDGSIQPLTTTVTWSVLDPTIATISNGSGSQGLATSVAQGMTTVTATLGAVSGSTGLTVTPASLVSIAVTPANPTIFNGTNQQFTATGTYTDNSTQDLSSLATWASTVASIATIGNATGSQGLASAVGVGTTSITATWLGVTSPATTLTSTADPQYAYSSNQNDNTLTQYTIGTTGLLTTDGNVATGNEPNAVVEDPSGRYVYVANWVDATISQYTIGSGGALTGVGTVATGSNPGSIVIDPSGTYVYVANTGSSTISEFSIGAGGVLTPIGTLSPSGNGPACIIADPTGTYIYTADEGGTVSQYTIGAGGVLSLTASVAAGNNPQSVAVDRTGQYAYVANYNDGTLSEYTVGSSGTLTLSGTIATGSNPESVTVDPTGHYVYVANYGSANVFEYKIGTGGQLTLITMIAAGNGPWFVTADASGRFVYVGNFNDSSITEYSIGTNGALTLIGTVSTGSGPNAIDTGF
jgi:trimeric autotransporter adhesin